MKGYILYDLLNKSVFISRNAIFYEDKFPYQQINISKSNNILCHPNDHCSDNIDLFSDLHKYTNSGHSRSNMNKDSNLNIDFTSEHTISDMHHDHTASNMPAAYFDNSFIHTPIDLKRSNRIKKAHLYLNDFYWKSTTS